MSCAVFPPCHAVRPGLVVAIAEAVDDYTAPDQPPNPTQQVPIRMRLRKLIYGHSPGQEFTLQWFAEVSLRAGELIYIEESNAPLRTRACGQTDSVSANTATRQKFFQELAAGKHQGTYVRIGLPDGRPQRHPPLWPQRHHRENIRRPRRHRMAQTPARPLHRPPRAQWIHARRAQRVESRLPTPPRRLRPIPLRPQVN